MSYLLGCLCNCSEGQDQSLFYQDTGGERSFEKVLEIEQAKDGNI